MNSELKKRIFTSIFLLVLLAAMYFYSFLMIISLIIMTIILWVEFYALVSKIIPNNTIIDKFFRFFYKTISLLY